VVPFFVANREVVSGGPGDAPEQAATLVSTRSRSPGRRQGLIEATRELLREHGWHSVSIGDIGAAAGITGPGVYRHFKNKEDLLAAVLQDAADQLWRGVPVGDNATPAEVLEAYIDSHINFAVNNAAIVELWYQESRHLPEPVRSAQRRLQRGYIERWNDALLTLYPHLPPDEARLMVRGAIGLIHSIVHSDGIFDTRRLTAVLRRMVVSALNVAADGPAE
jgi:AcrR family transcriptional regulator